MTAQAARSRRFAALGPLRERAREYWQWWTAELAALIPPALRARLAPPASVLLAEPEGDALRFRRLGRGGPREASPAEAARLPLWLGLPAEAVLAKEIELPLLSAGDLRRAAILDLDRQTPLPAAALWFDVIPIGLDPRRRRLRVRLLVARATAVEAALARLAAAHGLRGVGRVGLAVPGGLIGDLRPATPPAEQAARRVGPRSWLMALCVALGLLNLGLYFDAEAERAARLEAAVAEARTRLARVDALRTQLTERRRLAEEIAGRRGGVPMLAILDELTRRIPDGAWLESVEVRGGAVLLSGHASSAVALVSALEASPLFAEAAFRAPVTTDRAGGRERFDMALRLRPMP
jgi:general secretion pathway protein L